MSEVERITGIKRSTIYKKLRTDDFPHPIPLSNSEAPGAPVGFLQSEVYAWIESCINRREGR